MNRKEAIRSLFKSYRDEFSDEAWSSISVTIQKKLIEWLKINKPQSVCIYLESNKSREIGTGLVRAYLREEGIKISVPRVGSAEGTMEMVSLKDEGSLILNKWGIPEPRITDSAVDYEPELIVVPMLGGDISCSRIGYGKGYYDRYLNITRGKSIGLCPSGCIINKFPVEKHDKKLNFIITEANILRSEGV